MLLCTKERFLRGLNVRRNNFLMKSLVRSEKLLELRVQVKFFNQKYVIVITMVISLAFQHVLN